MYVWHSNVHALPQSIFSFDFFICVCTAFIHQMMDKINSLLFSHSFVLSSSLSCVCSCEASTNGVFTLWLSRLSTSVSTACDGYTDTFTASRLQNLSAESYSCWYWWNAQPVCALWCNRHGSLSRVLLSFFSIFSLSTHPQLIVNVVETNWASVLTL